MPSSQRDTRAALLAAALERLSVQSFDATSLREVTRDVGVVPTAFYRHFPSMEALGLELVEASFLTLRGMLRDARDASEDWDELAAASVRVLRRAVEEHPRHLRFIARERHGGVEVLRLAIARELGLATTQLSDDLARHPHLASWTDVDRRAFAELVVTILVGAAGRLLEADLDEQAEIAASVERQLQIVTASVSPWGSLQTPASP